MRARIAWHHPARDTRGPRRSTLNFETIGGEPHFAKDLLCAHISQVYLYPIAGPAVRTSDAAFAGAVSRRTVSTSNQREN